MQDVTVTVIGAGSAGCLAALKSAEKSTKVLLLDKGTEVLPVASSSRNGCGKLHTGVHFTGDLATAQHCLQEAVALAREFPNFLVSEDLLSPWRRGRYYIMSNSLVSVEKAKDIVCKLQDDYAQLVADDERNKVFGEPENFIRFLSQNDYPNIAKKIPFYGANGEETDIHVALGIETAESQIDMDKLQADVQHQIEINPNITFMPSQEVSHIARDPSSLGYLVTTKNEKGEEQTFKTRTIVNCAWQNIETLNKTLGLSMPDDERVVRVKLSVLIELPESLRNMNTCIFSSGPYASITVWPDGTAVLTSERTTNAGFFKAGVPIPEPIKELLANMTLDKAEGQGVAQKMLFECASYLSEEVRAEFLASSIKELRVGFVKIMGAYTKQSIYQANSCIHARLDDGVEEFETGFIANAAMKMTYAANNATIVSEILPKHLAQLDKMDQLITQTKDSLYRVYPYLLPLSATIDLFLYTINRSLIEEKISSLAYEQDAEKCINELIEMIVKKTNSLVIKRCGRFFSNLYIAMDTIDKIVKFAKCEINLQHSSSPPSSPPASSSPQRSCRFFSEDRPPQLSPDNSVGKYPITSWV